MSKKNQSESNNIRVVCRCRPLNKLEIEQGGGQCVNILDDTTIQVAIGGEDSNHTFNFDKIFASNTRQIDVFKEVGLPVLNCIMSGINATIFAYGQTSSGKTHTMEGKHDDPEYMGLIPRMMERLFELIAEAPNSIEFTIKASFLEIYNEKIHDLLDATKTNLSVKEDKLRGIFVQDATEAFVVKAGDMMKVMRKGAENRSVAATRMNENSSRSHSIFLLTLIQKNTETETTKLSKLYFVDLAGSEKIAKTQVSGQQLEEAKNINKSLTCLGIVINALSEKKDHIPYRDSKLTRILSESIGGNSKTTLIIACSMCSYNDKETVSTLRFGQRAKSIKNAAKVNEEKSSKELMQLLTKAENTIKFKDEVIAALQQQLGQEGMSPTAIVSKLNKSSIKEKKNSLIDCIFCFEKIKVSQVGFIQRQQSNTIESVNNEENEKKTTLESEPQQKQEDSSSAQVNSAVSSAEAGSSKTTKQPRQSKTQTGQSSRKLLEQHLEIIRLKERIQTLEGEKNDIEIDFANKTSDLQTQNDKTKQIAEQLELTNTQKDSQIKICQLEIQALQVETLEWNNYTRELKKSTKRLGCDLDFLLVSAEVDSLDTNATESGTELQEGRIKATIKRTLEQIDSITDYINKFEKEQSMRTMTEGSDNAEDRKLKTDGDEYRLKRRENSKIKSFISPSKKEETEPGCFGSNSANHNAVMSEGQQSSTFTDPEDLVFTEESAQGSYLPGLIMERDESEENINNNNNNNNEDDDDISDILEFTGALSGCDETMKQELQTYIVSLKRSVRKLSDENQELTFITGQQRQRMELTGSKYKKKMNEVKQMFHQKIRESETKIASLHIKFNEKASELKNLTLKHEKELIEKNQAYSTLKVDFENLKKVIQSNHPASKIVDLQQKIKDMGTERQKLFNQIFAARKELDDKESIIKEKDSQIALLTRTNLKNNGEFHNLKPGNEILVTSRAAIVERKGYSNGFSESDSSKKIKSISMKSHIAPSIRGGGGDMASFQKNNQYLLSEECADEQLPNWQNEGAQGFNKKPIQDNTNPSQNDESNPTQIGKLSNNRIDEEEDMVNEFAKIEGSQVELQKRFKVLGHKDRTAHASLSQTSSLMGAMRKLFM